MEVSLRYLGPATRRTDAYRNGTLTRWNGAASQAQSSPFGVRSLLNVTTHHAAHSRESPVPTIAVVKPILNISGYRFVELNDAASLRESMYSRALMLGLRGTVILAGEGINLALAGLRCAVQTFIDELRADSRFRDLECKVSECDELPFGRLRVKLKREIIRMNQPAVQPARRRAPGIDATTLARWLRNGRDDAGREVLMLDTRNAFEVDHGRFRRALDWRLGKFSDFPGALQARRDQLKDKTVVSYCTGGIRCEKAAWWMQQQGIDNVLQLDGGILKYFELAGGEHFEGTCFVFDGRTALDASLAPAP